jgi:Heparinase II/III-like protein
MPLDSGNRYVPCRGIRLPLDNGSFFQSSEWDCRAAEIVEAAVGKFKSNHPYLLLRRPAITLIQKYIRNSRKLRRRLEVLRAANNSDQGGTDARTALKRQARRLINTSFMALISEGDAAEEALRASRALLLEFASAPSWRRRPVIKSFLDCAEIAVAVSLAYDWLFAKLSDEERRAVEEAIFRHVLEPALAAYQDQSLLWPRRRDNCALVSNSGILIASLAVLDRYRDSSTKLLEQSLTSSRNSFKAFAPDGAWPEGLSYWSLAMRYAALMVAALESAFSTSFGLADQPGFAETGDFVLHAVGPFGAAFNFGDSDRNFDAAPLAWFAHRFRRPIDAWLIRDYDGAHFALTAIWTSSCRATRLRPNVPSGKVFRGNGLACFRNTWSSAADARPVYLAIKGGNNAAAEDPSNTRPENVMLHMQADAGSFIVDGARRRWVIDLGPDDYDLPGYFDHGADARSGARWHYYRTQATGHNTLVVNGSNQVPNAATPILGSRIEAERKWVVFDLSAAYGLPAGAIRRGAALIGRRVIIQDEIDPDISEDIMWAVHTSADADSIVGSVARFRSGDDRFVARILEPSTARFELTFPPPPRAFPITDSQKMHGRPLPGEGGWISELPRRDDDERRAAGPLIKRLEIAWPRGARRLSVLLLPDSDDVEQTWPVAPLDQWLAKRTNRSVQYPEPLHLTRGFRVLKRSSPTALSPLRSGTFGTYSQKRIEHA